MFFQNTYGTPQFWKLLRHSKEHELQSMICQNLGYQQSCSIVGLAEVSDELSPGDTKLASDYRVKGILMRLQLSCFSCKNITKKTWSEIELVTNIIFAMLECRRHFLGTAAARS